MRDPAAEQPRILSFRDPAGQLLLRHGRVFRIVRPDAAATLSSFLESPVARLLTESGAIVSTQTVDERQAADVRRDAADAAWPGASHVVEHERVPFASFPGEWPPEMLHAAAGLTLDLGEQVLDAGFGLKDATPWNVLFRGPSPVFVDLLSFERRTPRDATWLPYAQFVRTFVLPLLAARDFHLPLSATFSTRRDGLQPAEVYRMSGWRQRLRSPYLTLTSMPTWLERCNGQRDDPATLYAPRLRADAGEARFVLSALFRSLRRTLHRARPTERAESAWSGYDGSASYTNTALDAKRRFVAGVLDELRPGLVLDVGTNTGDFAVAAARVGAQVVAIDADPVVVGTLWRRASRERLDVLPLVVDVARPTPSIGWRNAEQASFLDRALGAFDCVMLLAVLHHLVVEAGIPLVEVIDLAADLTRQFAVIEFVAPEDPMFRRLARGRDDLFRPLTTAAFGDAVRRRFDVLRSAPVPDSHRTLYVLRRR